jgi:N-acetylmuramoyl-L-alanine amidase
VDDELVGILFDLKQTEAIQQSSVLAEAILGEIENGRKLESRGVKQAPFAVLKSPVVPSVLVETAFINNPTEERLLRDSSFQSEMAAQIARGVLSYLAKAPPVARTRTSAPATPAAPAPAAVIPPGASLPPPAGSAPAGGAPASSPR